MLGMARQRLFGLYRRQIEFEPYGIMLVADAARMSLHSAGGVFVAGDNAALRRSAIFPDTIFSPTVWIRFPQAIAEGAVLVLSQALWEGKKIYNLRLNT